METNVVYFSFEECCSDFDMNFIGAVSPVPYPEYSLEPEVPSLSSFSGNSAAHTAADVNSVNSASDSCTACWCRKVGMESTAGKCVRYAGSKAISAVERELSQFVDHSRRFDVEDITFASGDRQRRCGRCNAEGHLQTVNVNGTSRDTFAPVCCRCNTSENFNARICLALEKLCDLKKSDSKLLRGLTCQIGELQRQQSELYAAMSDRSKESTEIPRKLVNGREQNERVRLSKCKSEVSKSESKNCRSVYDSSRARKDTTKFKQPRCVSNKTTCTKRMKLPYERLPEKMKCEDSPNSRCECESETSSSKRIPTFYEKLLKKAEKFLQRHTEAMDLKSPSSSETTDTWKERSSTSESKDDDPVSRSMCPDEIDICERTVRSQGNDLVDAKTSYHLSDVIGDVEPVISNLSLESRRYLQRYNIVPSK